MTPDQFLNRCPSLWHVGPAGSWERIARTGFQTAQQLIRDADLDDVTRTTLFNQPRRDSVRLMVNGDEVVLRDQGPLFQRKDLSIILGDGLSVGDWVQILNQRIYLFTDQKALQTLLDKYVEHDGAQDVLTLSPSRLLRTAGPRIQLAAQNTGAVARKSGPQKGLDTFLPLSRFPDRKPAEVTVVNGLDDLSVVVRAERHEANP